MPSFLYPSKGFPLFFLRKRSELVPRTMRGTRERGIFSFSKENSSFFAQVRMSMRHKCRVMRPPFSFPRKKTGGVTVQKKGVCIVCLPLNSLFACGLHCLPSVVSKRLGLLLSPLSLYLHIGSLHQSPSISDILLYFIIVDRSVSFQQIQVYMQSFSASLVLHTVFCLSADQFVQ